MGACFNTCEITATYDSEAVTKMNALIREYEIEFGNSGYTGTFAEANGAEVISPNLRGKSAEDYLHDVCFKGGPAVGIKIDTDVYLFGAVCRE